MAGQKPYNPSALDTSSLGFPVEGDTDIVSRAKRVDVAAVRRMKPYTKDERMLVIAWLKGEIVPKQAEQVLGLPKSTFMSKVAYIIREMTEDGEVTFHLKE